MSGNSVTCPECQATLKLPPEATPGKTIRCPKCGRMMPVPAADAASAASGGPPPIPVPAPTKDLPPVAKVAHHGKLLPRKSRNEEFEDGEIHERFQALSRHKVRANQKRPPGVSPEPVEALPEPPAQGMSFLRILLLFLSGLVVAGAATYFFYFRQHNGSAGVSKSSEEVNSGSEEGSGE